MFLHNKPKKNLHHIFQKKCETDIYKIIINKFINIYTDEKKNEEC